MTTNFPGSLDSFTDKTDNTDDVLAAHVNNLQDAVYALEVKVGIDSSGADTSIDYKVNNFFVESTRKLWLYENTAPTGWSTVAVTDKVLAVKGGTEDYNTTGGNTAGAWAVDGMVSGGSHNHQWYDSQAIHTTDKSYNSGGTATNLTAASSSAYKIYTPSGGGVEKLNADWYTSNHAGHTHTFDGTYRPFAAVGIIVQYDGS